MKSDENSEWPWAESLDALLAAPKYHTLLMEDELVRVIHTRIPAGETVPLHTHRWNSVVIILSWSDCIRRDEEGSVTYDSRGAGTAPQLDSAISYPPLPPHSLENIGANEISTISVEMKTKLR